MDNVASGTLDGGYIYDTANADALVGYSDTVSLNFIDIKSFMDARPDAPTFMYDTGAEMKSYQADTGGNQWRDQTVVDAPFKNALTAAGYNEDLGFADIGDHIIHAMWMAVDDQWEIITVDADFKAALSTAGYAETVGIGDTITSAMMQAVMAGVSGYVADPKFTLTELMGGANAFSDVAASTGSGPDEMGIGAESRYDEMGNQIQVTDDGYGKITEIMTDPNDVNIQIKTEFLANGDVVVTELITDPNTKVVTSVEVGSGSKVEAAYYDEITSQVDGLQITEREYDMANVYSKVEVGPGGEKTELTQDARGVAVETVLDADNSFVETTTSADGKTVVTRTVDDMGMATITTAVMGSDGTFGTPTAAGSGYSYIYDGYRTDFTTKPDGTSTEVTIYDNGDEVWTILDANYVEVSTSIRTTREDGSTEHLNIVNGQEIFVTYTTQADASLKAVYKTPSGTTLKEELTTYDAAGTPTVTAKEFLGENHTRVTVSDAETTTTVTTEASGAVTKAVKDIAADKTVTTTVDAAKAVTVTEQTGTAPAVTTATGTLTVQSSGQETLDLTTQDAAGNVTGSKKLLYLLMAVNERKTLTPRVISKATSRYMMYHDGTVWTELSLMV